MCIPLSLRCIIEHPNFAGKDFTRVTIFKDKFEVTVGTLAALSVMVVFNVLPSGRCLSLLFKLVYLVGFLEKMRLLKKNPKNF